MNQKKTILIVEEDRSYRELLKNALSPIYTIIDTGNLREAIHLASLTMPDLIMIDIEGFGREGTQLCEKLKEDYETRDIPVLFIASITSNDEIILGLKAGASDYITKPLCLPEVFARIESHLRTQDDYAGLERKDLLMLLQLSETISVTRSPNVILRIIVNKMSKIMNVTRCSIVSIVDGKEITVMASSDLAYHKEIVLDKNKYPEIRKAIETKQPVIVNDVTKDPLMASVIEKIGHLESSSIVVIPLIKKESIIGTFLLRTISRETVKGNDRIFKLSQLVASIAANALENAILFESVKTAREFFEEVSIRDELTKLFNRRYFYDRLKEEFSRSVRHGEPLSLLFIDVDDFKQINDTYGHAIGDDALKEIGCILKNSARESDIPARCGGDEFAIMLPNTNDVGAHNTALRISKTIQHHELTGANNCKLSVSIGHATQIGNNVTSYDALVKLADDAMYKSKSQGKGRVIQA